MTLMSYILLFAGVISLCVIALIVLHWTLRTDDQDWLAEFRTTLDEAQDSYAAFVAAGGSSDSAKNLLDKAETLYSKAAADRGQNRWIAHALRVIDGEQLVNYANASIENAAKA